MIRVTAALRISAIGAGLSLAMAAGASTFDAIEGWEADDHAAALRTFCVTCDLIPGPGWVEICAEARALRHDAAVARAFFESRFRPVVIGTPPALITGYYEPELEGSAAPDDRFAWPVHAPPPDLDRAAPWYSRAEIEAGDLLSGRGLELVWLDDPVALFFLQIQGSGRVRLRDGQVLRLGYAARNNHPYRSIGAELVRRGIFAPDQVSAQSIRDWLRDNTDLRADLFQHNASYVFFRILPDLPPDAGPEGAMGRSITALRSVAVDPAFVPLGAPVWVEKGGPDPLRRLMIAQDTGSAIRGAQRADLFMGTGAAAGAVAGRMRDPGRLVVLLPLSGDAP